MICNVLNLIVAILIAFFCLFGHTEIRLIQFSLICCNMKYRNEVLMIVCCVCQLFDFYVLLSGLFENHAASFVFTVLLSIICYYVDIGRCMTIRFSPLLLVNVFTPNSSNFLLTKKRHEVGNDIEKLEERKTNENVDDSAKKTKTTILKVNSVFYSKRSCQTYPILIIFNYSF